MSHENLEKEQLVSSLIVHYVRVESQIWTFCFSVLDDFGDSDVSWTSTVPVTWKNLPLTAQQWLENGKSFLEAFPPSWLSRD